LPDVGGFVVDGPAHSRRGHRPEARPAPRAPGLLAVATRYRRHTQAVGATRRPFCFVRLARTTCTIHDRQQPHSQHGRSENFGDEAEARAEPGWPQRSRPGNREHGDVRPRIQRNRRAVAGRGALP
jgi:hypothetical protein